MDTWLLDAVSALAFILAPFLGLYAAWWLIERAWRLARGLVLSRLAPSAQPSSAGLFDEVELARRAKSLAWSFFMRHPDRMPAEMRQSLDEELQTYGLTLAEVVADRRRARSARTKGASAPRLARFVRPRRPRRPKRPASPGAPPPPVGPSAEKDMPPPPDVPLPPP